MRTREPWHHQRSIRAVVLLATLVLPVTAGSCRRPSNYPIGVVADFQIRCVRQLWPGSPRAPYDLREAYCACLLQRAERRWNVAQFDRIRWQVAKGDLQGLPPEFVTIMEKCKSDLQAGRLSIDD